MASPPPSAPIAVGTEAGGKQRKSGKHKSKHRTEEDFAQPSGEQAAAAPPPESQEPPRTPTTDIASPTRKRKTSDPDVDSSAKRAKGNEAPAAPPIPSTNSMALVVSRAKAAERFQNKVANLANSGPTEAHSYKDRALDGCVEVTIVVIESRKAKDPVPVAGKAAASARIHGVGIVLSIEVRDSNCGTVLLRAPEKTPGKNDGAILSAKALLVVETGAERARVYVPAHEEPEFVGYTKQFEPWIISVGEAFSFSVYVSKDCPEPPPVGAVRRFNGRHTVVIRDGIARDYSNTPGTPMKVSQYGQADIYDHMVSLLKNYEMPLAVPQRYDGIAEAVRFPLYFSTKLVQRQDGTSAFAPEIVFLSSGGFQYTDAPKWEYTPPTDDERKMGRGENRPVDLSVQIRIQPNADPSDNDDATLNAAEMVIIHQSISIFPGALVAAVPGLSRTAVTALLTDHEGADFIDKLIWFRGKFGSVPMTLSADRETIEKAEQEGYQLTVGFAQPEASAQAVFLRIGRLLEASALKLHHASPLVTEAIGQPMNPEVVREVGAGGLTVAAKKDLREHRAGTAAVLCAEVAQCLAGKNPSSQEFRTHQNIEFYALPADKKRTFDPKLNKILASSGPPDSVEYADMVKACVKAFTVYVYITPEVAVPALCSTAGEDGLGAN